MSNINDIERWSYRISCGVLESKAIKKMLFFKIWGLEILVSCRDFGDIQSLGSLLYSGRDIVVHQEESLYHYCAEKFNWALSPFMYWTLIMASEKERTHSLQG